MITWGTRYELVKLGEKQHFFEILPSAASKH